MSENNKLQKKIPDALKERSQYALAFGVIATMLYVAGFPMFVIFFFGIFAYLLWKIFAQPQTSSVREVFEFYLSANEILRDDERRWFGFEVQEVVWRGEKILQSLQRTPPLVHFALGALYHKTGDYNSAVNHLTYVVENENADEISFTNPSPELAAYVKVLRKIEREPAEAPQTSAAVRALERARRNRGKAILEQSRHALHESNHKKAELEAENQRARISQTNDDQSFYNGVVNNQNASENAGQNSAPPKNAARFAENGNAAPRANGRNANEKASDKTNDDSFAQRQPISEVLRDIYDKK